MRNMKKFIALGLLTLGVVGFATTAYAKIGDGACRKCSCSGFHKGRISTKCNCGHFLSQHTLHR